MNITALISEIRRLLDDTAAKIDPWLDCPADLLNYKPRNGGWTIFQILEHIALTNHFLLILIEKGARKSLSNANPDALQEALATYEFRKEKLDEVGLHKSFAWIRPEHMEPRGLKSRAEIRAELLAQHQRCLHFLEILGAGEGLLHRTTMTVNDLGKLNVYEYIYFLCKHAERHVSQMQGNQLEHLAQESA